MVYNIKEGFSAKQVFVWIVDAVADTTTATFKTNPFWHFLAKELGATYGFTDSTYTSPFTIANANIRLDNISTNLTVTEVEDETEDTFFLGSDSNRAHNQQIDYLPRGNFELEIETRGLMRDFMKLKSNVIGGTAGVDYPTGISRYNFGTRSSYSYGILCVFATSVSDTTAVDPSDADHIYQACFFNYFKFSNVGIGANVDGEGKVGATISGVCKSSDSWGETYSGSWDAADDDAYNLL